MKVTLRKDANALSAQLSGPLNERSIGALQEVERAFTQGSLALDCRGVDMINSVGARLWDGFIAKVTLRGPVELHNCSAFFADYANLVPSMVDGCIVRSFCAPYRCDKCDRSEELLFQAADVRSGRATLGQKPCTSCGGVLMPDVAPDSFLEFLDHAKA